MSAILNGIRDRIKDRHPDSFSFREYDVEVRSTHLFTSEPASLFGSLAPRTRTIYEFSWGWDLTASPVSCTLSLNAEDVVTDDLSVSMWVGGDHVAWYHNGVRVGPEFNFDNAHSQQAVSFRKNDRRHPDGLMALLDSALETPVA